MSNNDAVNHPGHYNQYSGFEVIDVCEQLRAPDGSGGYNRGNAFKYLARAGWKNEDKHIEDLRKAVFYIKREIERLGGDPEETPDFVCNSCKFAATGEEQSIDFSDCSMCGDSYTLQLDAGPNKGEPKNGNLPPYAKKGLDDLQKMFQLANKKNGGVLFPVASIPAKFKPLVAPWCPTCKSSLVFDKAYRWEDDAEDIFICPEGHGRLVISNGTTPTWYDNNTANQEVPFYAAGNPETVAPKTNCGVKDCHARTHQISEQVAPQVKPISDPL